LRVTTTRRRLFDCDQATFSTRSFASTNPKRADLFLERVWQLDENGDFIRPLLDNWGLWVAHDTISHIEFFDGGPS
jgi:hypothetical protein